MMVVDTSALIAILQNEPRTAACMDAVENTTSRLISAGTIVETLIVAMRRSIEPEMTELIESLELEIISVTAISARKTAAAYRCWGKGINPAGLNYGDCFAYALARENNCPLLYVGNDFSKPTCVPPCKVKEYKNVHPELAGSQQDFEHHTARALPGFAGE